MRYSFPFNVRPGGVSVSPKLHKAILSNVQAFRRESTIGEYNLDQEETNFARVREQIEYNMLSYSKQNLSGVLSYRVINDNVASERKLEKNTAANLSRKILKKDINKRRSKDDQKETEHPLIRHPVVTVSPRVKRELESRQFACTG